MHLDPEGTSLVPVAENLPGGDLCPLPASESISPPRLPSVWAWGWDGRTGSRITTLPDIRHPLSCLHWAGPLWAWHCPLWVWHPLGLALRPSPSTLRLSKGTPDAPFAGMSGPAQQ